MSSRNIYKQAARESALLLRNDDNDDFNESPQSSNEEENNCYYEKDKTSWVNEAQKQFSYDDDIKLDIDWSEFDEQFVLDKDTSSTCISDVTDIEELHGSCDENIIEDTPQIGTSLSDDLRFFYLKFHPSRTAMNFLLKSLGKHNIPVPVPQSVHVLLKRNDEYKVECKQVSNGKMAYISIADNLKYIVDHKLIDGIDTQSQFHLHLRINVDGLPLFSGSNYQLWPILMLIEEYDRPLPLALFGGVGKPEIHEYLQHLCDELTQLQKHGIRIGKTRFYVERTIFVCDAPARSFIQCINPHTAYYGCGYCKTKGEYYENRVIFLETNAASRTDEDYSKFRENNQSSESPLIGIVPLKTSFPPEYMHLVLLGVMKKIMFYTLAPTKGCVMKARLSRSQIVEMSAELIAFSKFLPKEFQRKFNKGLSELTHFKATEYRTLLLYVGPYIFQPFMKQEIYNHFMLLSFGMYCLVSAKYYKQYHSNAKACLVKFVQQFSNMYDRRGVSYNVHVLQHLPDYVEMFGPLDSFSSFSFENHLGILKRRIKPSSKICEQSLNRIMDIREMFRNVPVANELYFSERSPDNCTVLEDGRIVVISSIVENLITGKVLKWSRNLFTYPYPSCVLKIGYYSLTRLKVRNVSPFRKCMLFPKDSEYLVIPLI